MADAIQSGGVQGQAMTLLKQAQGRVMALPAERRRWLGAGVLMLLAVGSGVLWFAGRTDWRPLFSGLESKDVQQVSQELAGANIPFEMTADGTGVQVPAEMLDKARMEVAAKGMPQTGRLGYELFDKPNWVGSEFDEKVNYQRALEGELEHTIGTLGVVKSARVHLVLPSETLFASEAKVAKASVVLKLRRSSLSAEQTEAIRGLVAGAVENLSVDQVTLVDADGRANLDGRHGAVAGETEQALETKLVAMLEPLAGAGNVRATVNVTYDQGSEDRTDEIYDPSLSAAQSVQKTEQTSGGGTGHASGVPGTASNTPAAAVAGAVQGSGAAAAPGLPPLLTQKESLPVYPQNGGTGQTTRQESGTYAVTRHLIHTQSGSGTIKRVSTAVVVNDRQTSEGAGKLMHAIWKPRSAEEMHRLEVLAQAAVGFDAKRGDQVVMENVSFDSNVPELAPVGLEKAVEQAKALMQSESGLLRSGIMGLLGVLVIWFVLRPVAAQVVSTLKEPLLLEAGVQGVDRGALQDVADTARVAIGVATDGVEGRTRLQQQAQEPVRRLGDKRGEVFDRVADHVRKEPTESTRLLAAWIGSDEETA